MEETWASSGQTERTAHLRLDCEEHLPRADSDLPEVVRVNLPVVHVEQAASKAVAHFTRYASPRGLVFARVSGDVDF